MSLTGTELLQIWFAEVWDRGNAEAIDKYASADWVGHGFELPGPAEMSRLEKFKLVHQAFRVAFPTITITVDKVFGEGEFAAAHCIVRGEHTGEGLGFGPTGRAVNFAGTTMIRCVQGKIAESWETWDFASMYKQLGVAPPLK